MKKKWIAAGAAMLLLALVVIGWPNAEPPVTVPPPLAQPAPASPATPTPAPKADSAPAPWQSAPQGAAAPAPTVDPALRQKQLAELQALQASVNQQLQQGRQPDPKQVDATLAKLQEISGSSVVAGVNIDAVRANLAKAQQIQQIAQEIESEANKPGGADLNRLRELLGQLQKQQSQMRKDVTVAEPQK